MERKDVTLVGKLGEYDYNRPYVCSECGGIMIFRGVGEYECEDCHYRAYDDYGKARNYIEKNPGATSGEISERTGVSQKAMRQMLRESRLEIASDSKTFMKCGICGVNIRHGTLCEKCAASYHRLAEEQERTKRMLAGYGMDIKERNEGAMRFIKPDQNK
ncbi:winged helix-turn-helix domain-containing protein [Kineothrix sedimenti]|uniref:Winged helix-turn-helix domain-containing protein n=1 Tax=Kineothrix sedimenti TaxID=3123317 RepID=A0ABZ3F2K8_9FIRM